MTFSFCTYLFIYGGGGLLLLYWGAEWLLNGSVSIANKMGVSQLVIGCTLVAFATSAPELVVSIQSALLGNADVSIGNVVGSNICNIALILGICSMIHPLPINPGLITWNIPCMLVASLAFCLIFYFFHGISRISGVFLFISIVIYTYFSILLERKKKTFKEKKEFETLEDSIGNDKKRYSVILSVLLVIIGVMALVCGAKFFLKAVIELANALNLKESFVGLTIVAIGTSLPELATSIVATWEKNDDIAIGNIVGSCIFNIFAILGISSLCSPLLAIDVSYIDVFTMLGVSFVLALFIFLFPRKMPRFSGLFLFLTYCLYTVYLYFFHSHS